VRSPLERVAEQAIADAVAPGWGLRFDEFTYLPEGGGAYHWVVRADGVRWFITCDDLDTKPWLGTERDIVFDRLSAAYGTAMRLRASGADFVVAPLPTATGTPAERVDERHSVSVFAYVEGVPGRWGETLPPDDCEQLVSMLARLHACDADMHGVAERDVDVPGRHALEHALESLGAVWDGGPFADPARRQLVAHATTVADALAELDRLVLRLREIEPRVVLTHGEPHPGNLIRTAGGLVLLDWDTVAAARPERDLWMLAEIDTTLLDRYRDITGITPDAGALRAFRLVWALSDIASFTAQLRAEHGSDTDSRRALVALERILTGHEPCPYGQRQP
jgi:spectinomycin phosphotransferase